MQLSRRGAATVGSGLYNFMQQRAPSAAPTHACLPLPLSPSTSAPSPTPSLSFPPPLHTCPSPASCPCPQNPSPGWSILLLSLSFESELEARLPPFPIHVTVAANYFWPRHRRFYGRGRRRSRRRRRWYRYRYRENAICMESVRSSPVFRFRSFSSFAATGHPTVFPIFLSPFSSFLSPFLSLSLVSFSIVYVHGYTTRGVLYWIQKPRRLASFFPLDRNYGREILWNGTEIEPNRR